MILLSEQFDANVLSWRKDSEGRVVSLLVQTNAFKINLINIYAPTNLTDRKVFFDNLHEFFFPLMLSFWVVISMVMNLSLISMAGFFSL